MAEAVQGDDFAALVSQFLAQGLRVQELQSACLQLVKYVLVAVGEVINEAGGAREMIRDSILVLFEFSPELRRKTLHP